MDETKNTDKTQEKNKKLIYIIVAVVVVIASVFGLSLDDIETMLGGLPVYTETQAGFSVHFIDVGQGDCTLVASGGEYLLIDAGENGHETDVLNYLRSMGVKKLDYIIATHQHSDHIGGLPEVLDEFETDNIIMPRLTQAQTPTNSTYTAFLKAVKASGAKVISAKPGLTYHLGEAEFEILGPVTNDAEDINSMSAVTKITYGETSFLVTGDAEKDEELEIIDNGADLDCDVLKVGHHGSYISSCKEFISAASPEVCVISCGENNDYGHPHDAAVKRLKKQTDEIYRTDICGDIVMVSDGEKIEISYENQ